MADGDREVALRKLIEVAIPLQAINAAATHETSVPRRGHPSTLHLWWARRPLAACRAVLFSQMVDDPSSHPEHFPTPEAQAAERQRLFRIIEQLVEWENSGNERVLAAARAEIQKSMGDSLPLVLDPFAGGGSIPLEAQRLGLVAQASDLNPVAVLICKALIELPAKFAGRRPLHPPEGLRLDGETWPGARGLAQDVRHYGEWMLKQAERRIGQLYPRATLPSGDKALAVAWIWARTVACPNPACNAAAPLIRSFSLSTKSEKEVWARPLLGDKEVRFEIAREKGAPDHGTISRTGATCLVCGAPIPLDHVRHEGQAGRLGAQLVAIVADGQRERVYLPADEEHVKAADVPRPTDVPTTELAYHPRWITPPNYGLTHHSDLFTNRQLTALTTFSDLVIEARAQVIRDGGELQYADAVATYLACALSKLADWSSSLCGWIPRIAGVRDTFPRQALAMSWDFVEVNPLSRRVGNFGNHVDWVVQAIEQAPAGPEGTARQADAVALPDPGARVVVATDPPYYDNIGYANLADFFYVWLRRSIGGLYPNLFATMLTPKAAELVADPQRSGGKESAKDNFERGFGKAFQQLQRVADPAVPMTVFYAFKQADDAGADGLVSTGWETMLQALLSGGLAITGTWPMRTERGGRMNSQKVNSLASSVVIVCRPRSNAAGIIDRRGFIAQLRASLPGALRDLQQGLIAPVDLAQAAIGPGMTVFSAYSKIVEADGSSMRVGTALGLINQMLDEVLAEQEGEFDPDTRWAIAWFDEHGFEQGAYGDAETLSKAKVTSVSHLQERGVVEAGAGKVRLTRRERLFENASSRDGTPSVWTLTQGVVHAIEASGDAAAAGALVPHAHMADSVRDLAYRLFVTSERHGWTQDAHVFDNLVKSWPEILRLVAEVRQHGRQEALL
jgi:putative DNA methylase